MAKKIAKKKNVYAGVGISKNNDPFKAGKEAVQMAINKMQAEGGKKPTFGLVFCSGGKYGKNDKTIQKLVDGAHSVFGDTPWVGCTTCGEISNQGFTTESCVATAISSDYLQVGIGVGDDVHKNPEEAGRKAAEEAVSNLKREKVVTPYLKYLAEKRKTSAELMKMYSYFILLFSPGHLMSSVGKEEDVLKGVCNVVGKQIPIFGGTSGDDGQLAQTYQFVNGKIYKDAAIATAISAGVKIGFGFGHGYGSTGETCIVTKAKENLVEEINGRPAIEVYSKLLGMTPEELWPTKAEIISKFTPLASAMVKVFPGTAKQPEVILKFVKLVSSSPMGIVDIHGNIAVRLPRSVKGKSVEFYENIPQGCQLNKLKIDKNSILKSEINAVDQAVKDALEPPEIIFIFDCAVRRFFLGIKVNELVKDTIKKHPNAKFIGFGTMGEYTFTRQMGPTTNCATVNCGIITDKLVTD